MTREEKIELLKRMQAGKISVKDFAAQKTAILTEAEVDNIIELLRKVGTDFNAELLTEVDKVLIREFRDRYGLWMVAPMSFLKAIGLVIHDAKAGL